MIISILTHTVLSLSKIETYTFIRFLHSPHFFYYPVRYVWLITINYDSYSYIALYARVVVASIDDSVWRVRRRIDLSL